MRKQLLAIAAAGLFLAGCQTDDECNVEVGECAVPGSIGDWKTNVKDTVNFAFDKSNISDAAATILSGQADFMNKYKDSKFVIEGHTDSIGTEAYNMGLGARRAEAVRSHLVSKGVCDKQLSTVSYGESKPVAPNNTRDGRAQNRRAVTVMQCERLNEAGCGEGCSFENDGAAPAA